MAISSHSSLCSLSSIDEKSTLMLAAAATGDLLVRDFGWPSRSPRYHGDHTPESNPDWDCDPLESEEAQKEAFQKMERAYLVYMGNLSTPKTSLPKKKTAWMRYLPWLR